jgi:diadenylate cyclase
MDQLFDQFFDLVEGVQLRPIALVDIVLTAVLIYGVLRLIQGTRAVRLVIGAVILYLLFVVAQQAELILFSEIMQIGAVVGLVALVVIFQPELRRGLDRLGRLGSWSWLGTSDAGSHQRAAAILARSAARLSRKRIGALIVVERETGLGDMAETGVLLRADLSRELLASIFTPGSALHDGAVVVRGSEVVAAGVMLPLSERMPSQEHLGTRHRAAVGVTEQTDALAIVVSEETGTISLAEGGHILFDLDEEGLRQKLLRLLSPADIGRRARGLALRRGRRAPTATRPGEADATAESTLVDPDDTTATLAEVAPSRRSADMPTGADTRSPSK